MIRVRSLQLLYEVKRRLASIVPPSRFPYARLNDIDLSYLTSILGNNNVQIDDLDPYNTDYLKAFKGNSTCVLFPRDKEQLSAILRYCYSRKLAVVPQSGNTSLVGGSVPVYDEVILSLKKFKKEFQFDPDSAVLECDSGFVLEEVDNRLKADGYMMPWDLGSRGSCMLGGNISTAVGGVRRFRFGSVHNHVIGLDVTLADEKGSNLCFGSNLKKNNSGLHMHHSFIGAEGQLGVISGVKISVVPRPSSIQAMMLGAQSPEDCLKIVCLAKQTLCEILSAVELLDSECMKCIIENKQMQSVLQSNPPYTILIETMGTNEAHDKEKAQEFLKKCMKGGICSDGVQAMNVREVDYMWKLRKSASTAPMVDGYVFKHDLSLPLKYFFIVNDVIKDRVGSLAKRVFTFGHIADGDSHVNVTATKFSPELAAKLYPFLWEWVSKHGGSVSAEHGIGQERRPYRHLGKGYELEMAKKLKNMFDPRRILSPYKMI